VNHCCSSIGFLVFVEETAEEAFLLMLGSVVLTFSALIAISATDSGMTHTFMLMMHLGESQVLAFSARVT